MMSKRILVTGGAGFIGSFLVDRLVILGHQVTVFDNLESQVHVGGKRPKYLNPQSKFIQGDVRDYDVLLEALQNIEVVFHEAAAVGVGQSNYEIKRYMDVNAGGTANLLDAIVNHKLPIQKILTTSSMTAYGEGMYHCNQHGDMKADLRSWEQMEQKDWQIHCPKCNQPIAPLPTPETAPQPCNSVYALSKKTQEDMLHLVGKIYQIPITTLRCFNVYGPRQSLSNPYTGVTAIFISRLKNHKTPVVYEDGDQSRDFVSVHDVVNALVMSMDTPKSDYQICNIGSGKPTSIKNVATTLAKLLGEGSIPEISQTPRKNDIRHCFADISKAKEILGWEPKVSLEQGMKELIAWSVKEESSDDFDKATQELKAKGII